MQKRQIPYRSDDGMPMVLAQIREALGEEAYLAAEKVFLSGGVREASATGEQAQYLVSGDQPGRVTLSSSQEASCTCAAFADAKQCGHIISAMLMAKHTGAMERLLHTRAAAAAPRLMAVVDSALPEDGTVRLEVILYLEGGENGDAPRISAGLRIGTDRMYVVRSIPLLLDAIEQGTPLDFGKGFSYRPEWMRFSSSDQRIVDILHALYLARKEAGTSLRVSDMRSLQLPRPYAEALLDALSDQPFRIRDGEKTFAAHIRKTRLPLMFTVAGNLHGLVVTGYYPRELRPLTADCAYVMIGQTVVQVPAEQQHMMRLLWQEQTSGKASFAYAMRETPRVVNELIPYLKLTGAVEISHDVERMLEKLPLCARVYLDREGKDVVAQTQFVYGDRIIDPFNEAPLPETLPRGQKMLLRDATAERQVLDALGSSGFHVSKGRVYLSGQDNIYQFVSGGLSRLQEKCEVYASRDFQRMTPRKPMLQGTLRMSSGCLELAFTEHGEAVEELLGIMEALSRRRAYYRLKDGTFLDLGDMMSWQPVADAITEAVQTEGAERADHGSRITLSSYRLCYLASLLEGLRLPVIQDESVRATMQCILSPEDETIDLPGDLVLRPYQQRGYRWLRTLDQLHMGGILADDMGLGKTVQVIALLKAVHQPGDLSLVVAPTSLTYNWLSELNRFAPELSVMVLSGSGPQRASQISHIKAAHDVDVMITSYPLIRRDIDQLRDIAFRFAILDEAQQIKNAGSVGAVVVKQLKAQTRFALTGTPMENSTGELWSIFDFVLPGYLGGYAAFLRRYQDGQGLDDLRKRIRPFLMRRLKRDVLTELPDKIETVLTAQMTAEQQKVYQAAMLRLRTQVQRVMSERGLNRGRTEVLAAMTELRQICCHPQLVLDDYYGSSGKLELLMDILPGVLSEGRRVLLFSQFTSMLRILLKHLEDAGISCMYLDGETPAANRLEMTERFNGGIGQVFLISLKAGGTGLNLTGADMVIHYDPWWNPAAEDQATDRAHRIGQTKKVDVVRLVTHQSIEEQVVELGQRKKALFDQLITPGEELVTALTEADIRALFE